MSDLTVQSALKGQKVDLTAEEIHIWVLYLPELKSKFDALYSFLAVEEKAKADMFRKDVDRNQYILTRGGLRYLLGMYVDENPEKIVITYNKWGKPQLEQRYSLNFSLSHSVDYSLIAFTKSCEIGVDVEFINPNLNVDELVSVFLNPSEFDSWQNVPIQQKTEYFYKLWVGKEAFIKALGKGWLEREETINSLTILPNKLLSQPEGVLKTPQGTLHYFNIVPQYESAFFSNGHSLKPCIINFL